MKMLPFRQSQIVKKKFPLIDGLFARVNYMFPQEFQITGAELDVLFISNWGLRTVAPIVHVVNESKSEQLTPAELDRLATILIHMFGVKWDRMCAVYSIEYDPIHNYSDIYHEELDESTTGDSTKTYNTTDTNTSSATINHSEQDGGSQVTERESTTSNIRTDNLQESTTGNQDNGIFGFNSSEAVGDSNSASSGTRDNTGTVENSGQGNESTTITGGLTHTTTGTDATNASKRKTGTEGDASSSTRNRVREFSHIGNIGNLTSQQLITQELELWRWNIINEVLNDVKEFLTLPIYD